MIWVPSPLSENPIITLSPDAPADCSCDVPRGTRNPYQHIASPVCPYGVDIRGGRYRKLAGDEEGDLSFLHHLRKAHKSLVHSIPPDKIIHG